MILVVPFVAQTFAAVGLVWYLSFKSSQNSIYALAKHLETEVSARVNQHLDLSLSLPHQLNQLNANAIQKGILNPQDFETAGQYFWQQAAMFSDINWIGYDLKTGAGTGAGRWFDGEDIVINQDRSAKVGVYKTDRQGNQTQLLTTIDFDPLQEKWYTETVAAGKPIWSRTDAVGDIEGYIAVSANYPLYNSSQQLLGVLGADLSLSKLSNLLRRINVTPSSKVFILERNGLLIADSSNHKPFQMVNGQMERCNVLSSPDPLIQATATFLKQKFGSFAAIQKQHNLIFQTDQLHHFAQVTPWQDQYGLDWLVVTVIPESDFMAQINANNRTTLLLCLATLTLAILLGLYTARWITHPILRLSEASQAIAAGQLNQVTETAGVKELDTLARSFNQMANQLQASFQALEATNAELEDRVEDRTAELKTVLQNLQQAQAKLIHAEKMSSLGQLVAGVAHEINNPVNFIHGNLNYSGQYIQDLLDLLQLYRRETALTPALQAKIETIDLEFLQQDLPKTIQSMQGGTDRIREIVLLLRNFSRLDESDQKEANIHEGLDSTLMILQSRLKGKPDRRAIDVVKHYGQIPPIVCYPGQLNQVFMHILTNAIDALEASAMLHPSFTAIELGQSAFLQPVPDPTITISTQINRLSQLQISIADNGPGIPESVRSKLFDPFFTTKPIGQGTGLGLSISYQIIVEKHNGNLEVQAQAGSGAKFVITLPLKPIEQKCA